MWTLQSMSANGHTPCNLLPHGHSTWSTLEGMGLGPLGQGILGSRVSGVWS